MVAPNVIKEAERIFVNRELQRGQMVTHNDSRHGEVADLKALIFQLSTNVY